MITENVSTLKINKLTQEQYDRELANGNIDENALYLTPDDTAETYMTKENPTGTGSFSLNRKIGTTVGTNSVAIGTDTLASGVSSYAEGYSTEAQGVYSHAEGLNTIAKGNHQHVQGRFNIGDTNNEYAHIVGNGSYETLSNAHTLDWDGNAWFAGNVTVGENRVQLATLEPSGVTAGTYGGYNSSSLVYNIPNVTVDEYGRVTNMSNSVISSVSSKSPNSPGLVTYNQIMGIGYAYGQCYSVNGTATSSISVITDVETIAYTGTAGTFYMPEILSVTIAPLSDPTNCTSVNFKTRYSDGSDMTTPGIYVTALLPDGLFEQYKTEDSSSVSFRYLVTYKKGSHISISTM